MNRFKNHIKRIQKCRLQFFFVFLLMTIVFFESAKGQRTTASSAEIFNGRNDNRAILRQLDETISTLRQAAQGLEQSDKTCIDEYIRLLECYRRSYSSGGTTDQCRLPGCSSAILGNLGLDLDDFRETPQNSRVSAGSSVPVNNSPSYESSTSTPSRNTVTTTRPIKSGGSTPLTTRRISRTTPVKRTQNGISGSSNSGKPLDGKSVRTEAARCVAIESHEKTTQWLYVDAEKYNMKEQCNGHFKSGVFKANNWGSNRMFLQTYLYATVTNSKGDPRPQGCCLKIVNGSDRFPAYFGLFGVIGRKINPGQTQIIPLGIYYSKLDSRSTEVEIYLYWWEQK